MDSHTLWQLFFLTGLPQAYALAKALEAGKQAANDGSY